METLIPMLNDLFGDLNTHAIDYVVVRDYETVNSLNRCSDLDISVSESHRTTTLDILKKRNWYTPQKNLNHYSHQQFYNWAGERMYKLDIIWGFYFADGRYSLSSCNSVYAAAILFNGIKIPCPEDGILLLLLHILLDKKSLSKKNKDFMMYLLSNKQEDNETTLYARSLCSKDDIALIEPIYFIKCLLKKRILLKNYSLVRLLRLINRTFLSHFSKTRYRIALLGVDGCGKSTALASLRNYYVDKSFTQYFGFRDYKTSFAKRMHSSSKGHILNRYVYNILDVLSVYFEMWTRYLEAKRSGKMVLLFDRFVWEAADNSSKVLEKALKTLLFKWLFPGVDILIYLHCPVETSLSRKNDITDVDHFMIMKKRFDKLYMRYPNSLSIDTSIEKEPEVLEKCARFICERTDGLIY